MHDLWPRGDEALIMPVESLAVRLLRTLDSGRLREKGIHLRRGVVIGVAVSQHYVDQLRAIGETGTLQVDGDDAQRRFPDLARKYAEAWDLLVREGLVAETPASNGEVYVTPAGKARIAAADRPAPAHRQPPTEPSPEEQQPHSAEDQPPDASASAQDPAEEVAAPLPETAPEDVPQRFSLEMALRTLFGFAAAVGVALQIIDAPAVLLGATTGAALVVAVLHRVWRWPPPLLPIAAVLAGAAVGGVVAHVIKTDDDDDRQQRTARTAPTVESTTPQPRRAGQLAGGDNFLAVSDSGKLRDPITASIGEEARVVFRVDNVGPDDLASVRVRLALPRVAARTVAMEGRASSPTSNPPSVSDTLSIRTDGEAACLVLVSGSVKLDARGGAALRSLPEDVIHREIDLGGLSVSESPRYVEISVRPRPASLGARC
jgi:hypothetical protein